MLIDAQAFDNTFSKQLSKTATFVLLTYPSNAAPPESHALHHAESSNALNVSYARTPTAPNTAAVLSTESLAQHDGGEESSTQTNAGFQTGVLKKRKRKRHQGYARRFFSLDFTSSTLSYYLNRETSALRGAIPLSLAAISASKKDREICIDSGAEIWHLRANSDQEWETWKAALEKAARHAVKSGTTGHTTHSAHGTQRTNSENVDIVAEERGWAGVESLVGRISGIRDAVRRLAEPPQFESPVVHDSEATSSATSIVSADSAGNAPKKSFWKRKSSAPPPVPSSLSPLSPRDSTSGRKSISAIASSTSPAATLAVPNAAPAHAAGLRNQQAMGSNLQALLGDLDSVVADFSKLVAENKQRRWLHRRMSTQKFSPNPRQSMESTTSDEFFDAADALDDDRVYMLNDEENDSSGESSQNQATDDEASSDEDFDDPPERSAARLPPSSSATKGKLDLTPLPLAPVQRRTTLPPATQLPPSLIGFLRKNVGKDLSTIAMPVSANEPISLLQRSAEHLEYSELLDAALAAPLENGERLLHIAAFAVSSFSNCRIKDRSIRKPFNPMLGETYELVREDKNFRYICEKVSHRPVIMACHADSPNWTFSQNPEPTQKFWGKSAELNTTGRIRIHFPSTGDDFSYTLATSFLRNILTGEKYVEPTGSMHIYHEQSGDKATIAFKPTKGMFGGRSEELTVTAHTKSGTQHPYSLTGKWTEELTLLPAGRPIWTVGPLVDGGAAQRYGFTRYAAQLNEITAIEKGHLPPTDSRVRPDQQLCENGHLDEAEETKLRLEEKQRRRRTEMEESGEEWRPRWFEKVKEYADEEEVWGLVQDEKEGYWGRRKRGDWAGGLDVFDA